MQKIGTADIIWDRFENFILTAENTPASKRSVRRWDESAPG